MTESVVEISQLYVYPIKSFPGLAVNSIRLDNLGAVDDRRYMLVDENGKFVSQRQLSSLALVSVEEHTQGWKVAFKKGDARILPRQGSVDKSVNVTIWQDKCLAFDQGNDWAEWFSEGLGKSVRLIYTPVEINRRIDPDFCSQDRHVGFTDGYPLLVTSESSLEVINAHLDTAITMQRFRPNIVVSGSQAFAEDNWKSLQGKNNEFSLVKPCSRCVIPTINLKTAEKEKEVWQTLQKLRQAEDGKIYFGQNAIHQHEGELYVGEQLEVL